MTKYSLKSLRKNRCLCRILQHTTSINCSTCCGENTKGINAFTGRPDEKTIYIEKTKFKKNRLIPIPIAVAEQIDNYLSCRAALAEEDLNEYLFIGGKQNRLGDQRIRVIFHDAVAQIGINSPRKGIVVTTFGQPTPHMLGHSFAVNTLKIAIARKQSPENVLPVLANFMGHVEYRHTMKYLRVVDAKSRTSLLNFAGTQREES